MDIWGNINMIAVMGRWNNVPLSFYYDLPGSVSHTLIHTSIAFNEMRPFTGIWIHWYPLYINRVRSPLCMASTCPRAFVRLHETNSYIVSAGTRCVFPSLCTGMVNAYLSWIEISSIFLGRLFYVISLSELLMQCHYLDIYWRIVNGVLWLSPETNFTWSVEDINS